MLVGLFFVAIWFLTAALIAGIAMKFFDMFQTLYPFGMGLSGRKYQATSTSIYKYSINGQEKERELNENINSAEFWMYDSRLGRRWNIDPIKKDHESPYAAFANNPIWFTDPNGADTVPASLAKKNYNTRNWMLLPTYLDSRLKNVPHSHADDINNVYNAAGGDKAYLQNSAVVTVMNDNLQPVKANSIILPPAPSQAVTNLKKAFYSASESGSEKSWINALLGGMIRGTVPENIVFSENGTVSNYLVGSSVYENIMNRWYKEGMPKEGSYNVDYRKEQIQDLAHYGTFLTMSNFIGSCMSTVLVNENDNSIKITITNVSSVHSGDYAKHMYWHNEEPPMIIRNPQNSSPQPYSNFSQTFRLKLNLKDTKESLRIANTPVINPGGWRVPY